MKKKAARTKHWWWMLMQDRATEDTFAAIISAANQDEALTSAVEETNISFGLDPREDGGFEALLAIDRGRALEILAELERMDSPAKAGRMEDHLSTQPSAVESGEFDGAEK